jgi:hypothetical protein
MVCEAHLETANFPSARQRSTLEQGKNVKMQDSTVAVRKKLSRGRARKIQRMRKKKNAPGWPTSFWLVRHVGCGVKASAQLVH